MSAMSRRQFLRALAAGASAALAGCSGVLQSREEILASVVRDWLSDEAIRGEAFRRFTADFIQYEPQAFTGPAARLIQDTRRRVSRALGRSVIPQDPPHFQSLEHLIVEKFLLSTNYLRRQKEDDALVYWGYADPYVSRCSNPLAEFSLKPVRPS